MTIRTSQTTVLRNLLACAVFSALAHGCGAADDGSADDQPTVAAQIAAPRADAGSATSSATQTRCAIEYTECLLGAWNAVLTPRGLNPVTHCTAKAEACGLFDDAPDAGTNLTPSCGMEIADCYLKNPSNPGKCSDLPCQKNGTSAQTP